MARIRTLEIKIWENENDEGYFYNIYVDKRDGEDEDDGGLCTTTVANALEMAVKQTEQLIKQK